MIFDVNVACYVSRSKLSTRDIRISVAQQTAPLRDEKVRRTVANNKPMPTALLGACSGRAAGGLFGSIWVNPQGLACVSVEFKKNWRLLSPGVNALLATSYRAASASLQGVASHVRADLLFRQHRRLLLH